VKTGDPEGADASHPTAAPPPLSLHLPIAGSDGRWERKGDYVMWGGSRKLSEPGYALHEWIEKGVLLIPTRREPSLVHRIPAGRPYHVSHLFGFWILNDCDAIWLEVNREEASYYSLMAGGVSGKPAVSSCLWVCTKCAVRFGDESVDVRAYEEFLAFGLRRVRAFNADLALRTCPRCRAIHPLTYGFHMEADTTEERAAREAG
jgi:hypothetical protein